jgi:hypothetical protein
MSQTEYSLSTNLIIFSIIACLSRINSALWRHFLSKPDCVHAGLLIVRVFENHSIFKALNDKTLLIVNGVLLCRDLVRSLLILRRVTYLIRLNLFFSHLHVSSSTALLHLLLCLLGDDHLKRCELFSFSEFETVFALLETIEQLALTDSSCIH